MYGFCVMKKKYGDLMMLFTPMLMYNMCWDKALSLILSWAKTRIGLKLATWGNRLEVSILKIYISLDTQSKILKFWKIKNIEVSNIKRITQIRGLQSDLWSFKFVIAN